MEAKLIWGEGQFITSKGASKRKTRHKPNQPKHKGPHQQCSHRRKPDHYKDPAQGGGPTPALAHHYQPPQLKQGPQPQVPQQHQGEPDQQAPQYQWQCQHPNPSTT